MPTGFSGNLFRSPSGSLVTGIVSTMPRLGGRVCPDNSVCVQTSDVSQVRKVALYTMDGQSRDLPFTKEERAVQFDVPADTVAAVAELEF